jgi:hypothetical protein
MDAASGAALQQLLADTGSGKQLGSALKLIPGLAAAVPSTPLSLVGARNETSRNVSRCRVSFFITSSP